MDFAVARNNMVESQIHPNGITGYEVLEAMKAIAREKFVPQDKRALAYADEELEIAPGRYMLAPLQLGRLLKMAEISSDDVVLLIGSGTGYSAAVIGLLAQAVLAVEEDEKLAEASTENLAAMDITNAVVINGKHADGAPDEAPFDVILINGAVKEIPENLLAQLKNGGRLVCIRADDEVGHCIAMVRNDDCFCENRGPACNAALLTGFDTAKSGFEF